MTDFLLLLVFWALWLGPFVLGALWVGLVVYRALDRVLPPARPVRRCWCGAVVTWREDTGAVDCRRDVRHDWRARPPMHVNPRIVSDAESRSRARKLRRKAEREFGLPPLHGGYRPWGDRQGPPPTPPAPPSGRGGGS